MTHRCLSITKIGFRCRRKTFDTYCCIHRSIGSVDIDKSFDKLFLRVLIFIWFTLIAKSSFNL